MRNFLRYLFFICLLPLTNWAQNFPERSNTLVTDYTNTLQAEEKQALETKLVAFNDSTSTQISIVILSTLDGYPINDYAQKLGEKWGIGTKGKNNGALILVAINDHKVSIQTGYGLEGAIPDALAKRIITNDITPAFKQGAYYQGLDAATNTMISLAKGEYSADDYMNKHKQAGKQQFPGFLILLILGIICLVGFSKYRSVSSYATRNNVSFWVAWGLLNVAANSGRGRWDNFSGGNGGFGGFGGGSSGGGGGGFGGFGGGSFGGGGASGSW